jgi:glutamate N-acetyltransferase/amino-acid N-acetyltransferase
LEQGLIKSSIKGALNDVSIIQAGEPDQSYTEAAGSVEMAKNTIVITIEIGKGGASESVWTTDFSYDYVKINAEYRT